MRKGDSKGEKRLQHCVQTRITDQKFQEIKGLVDKTKDESMSGAIRKIILNRPIRILVHDDATDLLLEELATLRSEIKAIGVNINQITRYFNTYPEDHKKQFYAKVGLTRFIQMQEKVDGLTGMISELCAKWLSESKPAKGSREPLPTTKKR